MQGSIAFKSYAGSSTCAAWVFLCILQLALVVIALIMFCFVALMAFDEGGGAAGIARRQVTVGQRCAMGFLCGCLGLPSVLGALGLKRWHRRMNPLYLEMQVGLHLAQAMAAERVTHEHLPRPAEPMYDRDLVGGL